MGNEQVPDFRAEITELIDLIGASGLELRPEATQTLVMLAQLITRWNKAVNLVSRKDIARLVSYHFCDSASLLPILRPGRRLRMLDLGGSNGLPGIVLAALSPNLDVTICDSKAKRQAFLDEASAELGLAIRYVIDRADAAGFQQDYQEGFDLIVARAVTRLKLLLKWCLPLLKPGGYLVAYKGSRWPEEVGRAESMFFESGGRLLAVMDSPWAAKCNPHRLFAVAGKASS